VQEARLHAVGVGQPRVNNANHSVRQIINRVVTDLHIHAGLQWDQVNWVDGPDL
jgi:hypothetical protein